MDHNEKQSKISINDFHEYFTGDYTDGDLSICSDIKDLNTSRPIKMNTFLFLICLDGEIEGEMDSVQYKLSANDLLVCRPNKLISKIKTSPDFKCTIISISQQLLLNIIPLSDAYFNGPLHFIKFPVVHISNDEDAAGIRQFCNLLTAETMQQDGLRYHKEIILSLAIATVYKVMYYIDKHIGSNGTGKMNQSEIIFGKFINLISASTVKQRSVGYYAEKLYITPKYLSVVCKRISGKTASEWINEFVIKDIKKMLKHSSKSIKEIALELDFPNMSFFGKYVKAHLGESPSRYRKKMFD